MYGTKLDRYLMHNSYTRILIIIFLSKLFYQIYVYSKTIFLIEINDNDIILLYIYHIIDT
jgi:hypothetical protein